MLKRPNEEDVRVRDVINHLLTLPQDMKVRVFAEHEFTGEGGYFPLADIEIHDKDDDPTRPLEQKYVVLKIVQ
jgi:hypothetical protein